MNGAANRTLIAGIDGGQTSTKAIIATSDGDILATGSGPACDHLNVPGGLDRNRRAIHTALQSTAATAGITVHDLRAIGLGLTSAQRELDPVPRIATIVHEIASPETLWIDADIVSNLAGASGGNPGIVVIAGGGSIGYGVDHEGNEAISGGMGYLMGDEGSGWFLGIEGLRAAARAADRRGPATALLPVVLDHFGLKRIREIVKIIYRADFERNEISSLAPVVMSTALAGDAVARDIVENGVTALVRIACGVADQLFDPDEPVSVYPTGGVFAATELVLDPFTRGVEQARPGSPIHQPRFSPALGALFRAAIDHGIAVDEAFLNRVAATLPHAQSRAD